MVSLVLAALIGLAVTLVARCLVHWRREFEGTVFTAWTNVDEAERKPRASGGEVVFLSCGDPRLDICESRYSNLDQLDWMVIRFLPAWLICRLLGLSKDQCYELFLLWSLRSTDRNFVYARGAAMPTGAYRPGIPEMPWSPKP